MSDERYRIQDEAALESLVGKPFDFLIEKLDPKLDDAMKTFVRASSLAIVSTIDANGRVDVSPKGDPAGFVQIDGEGDLLIPERVGNRLTFGFRNILRNGKVGLIFLAPHQRETLRIKGTATVIVAAAASPASGEVFGSAYGVPVSGGWIRSSRSPSSSIT